MPPNVENGQYALVNGSTTYASIVEYICNEDYWLQPANRKRQICTKEGRWSADPPNCERKYCLFRDLSLFPSHLDSFRFCFLRMTVVTCPEPEVPPGGVITGYDYNVHSSIEYTCDRGYLLVGRSSLECTSQGEWDEDPPACQCKPTLDYNIPRGT